MINHSSVKTGLFGLIGLKQGVESGYDIVDEANYGTTTGLYYKDYHKLITVPNLYHIAPDGRSDAEFNTWWKDEIVNPAIIKAVNACLQDLPSLYEHKRLYKYEATYDQVLTLPNGFVGFEFDLTKHQNIRVVLEELGLFMDAADTFTLYQFHSHQQTAVNTITATATENEENWQTLDFTLDYSTDDYSGGKFYIGYKTADVSASPIDRAWDEANIESILGLVGIRSMRVPDYTGTSMFAADDVEYTSELWGLNFDIASQPDYTKMLITQKDKFVDVMGYQVARDVLEAMANSTRMNERKKEVRDLAYLEINEGQIESKLKDAIRHMRKSFQGVDPVTFPKKPRIRSYTLR